ncbi:MAG: FAD-dependent oxidoreductase [Chloroflexi bacterium]|nr:FAD-dependent oxidoreductase [Chloroflexota bacterium]MBI3170038.1 FAD-dependent oxidoreductase [Chloroflexota bacterium]
MPRTRLANQVQEMASVASEAAQRNTPVEEVIANRAKLNVSRRDFLKLSAAALAAVAFQPVTRSFAAAPRIAVVGAGLAGLTAAYRLKQNGYSATVFEASDRLGGRCWSGRGLFNDGQIIENGGELIDQGHTHIRQLCQELGLALDNLLSAEPNGTEDFYYFDGQPYSYTQATNDLKDIWQKIKSDVQAASYPTLYNLYTQRGWELDHMSIIDWINESVPGGIHSKLGQLLDVAYNIEYGGECNIQSSLNLLYLLGYSGQGQMRIFGPSNEKYHVNGGNDQIVTRMADALVGQIQLGKELVAIKTNLDGTVTLSIKGGKKVTDQTFDKVVLALPFSILKYSVDFSKAGFSDLKKTAINESSMGTNGKLQLQFTDRIWNTLGNNGATYADTGYQCTWDVTRGQPGTSGILVNYTGGDVGAAYSANGSPSTLATQFLSQVEPVLPGLTQRWNGKAIYNNWPAYKWTRGSYSFWKVGQYTQFSGAEREQQGNCHFAGEHTSVDFQGYLNGAVETGERAADEILAELK